MRTFFGILVAIIIIGGGWYWYASQSADVVPSTMNNTETTPSASNTMPGMMEDGTTSDTETTASGTVKEFTVTGSNFKFAPTTMTVKKGDTVSITFVNSGGMHDFVIDEFNARTKVIQGGAQETITFVADKAGSFEYYCSVGEHRQMGMKGTLTVTE